jgi:hypothetical protein
MADKPRPGGLLLVGFLLFQCLIGMLDSFGQPLVIHSCRFAATTTVLREEVRHRYLMGPHRRR